MKSIFRTFTWKLFWRTKVFLFAVVVVNISILIFFLWVTNLTTTQINRWGLAERIKIFLMQLPDSMQDELSYRNALQPFFAAEPGMGVFLIDQAGNVVTTLDSDSDIIRSRIDIRPIQTFLDSGPERRDLPLYGDDPRSRNRTEIFSAARFEGLGVSRYLYIILPTFLNNHVFHVLALRKGVFLLFCSFVLGGVLTSIFALLVYSRLTKRFYNLIATVRSFREGDRSRRLKVAENGDEVEELGAAFNEMADTITAHIKQLEEKDALRRELIANISHDLRGPTGLILGATELAATGELKKSPDRSERYLQVIGENASALKRLLDELHELAELETSEVAPNFCPFPPTELVADLLIRFAPSIERNKLTLRQELHTGEELAYGDPIMIERVLANLLENAIRYTPEGRAITVTVESPTPREVRFAIADEGRGISEAEIPHIFERHFQSSESSANKGASGLGLAIVKKILDAHSEEIHVRRLEPNGTEFAFTLPRASS